MNTMTARPPRLSARPVHAASDALFTAGAKAAATAAFFLLFAGGMVTSTGSGLAVPDWPLSFGGMNPPMIGGIFTSFILELVVHPAIFALWKWHAEVRPRATGTN